MRDTPETLSTIASLDGTAAPLAPATGREVISGVRRTMDPVFLNSVINHPEVRPWLQGEGELDLSHQMFNPGNIALQSEYGGFLLVLQEPGRYEVHSQFLPGHGVHPIKAMRAAQEWMFTRTDCQAIVSKVPQDNKAAKGLAVTGGLRPIFARDDDRTGPTEYVELTCMDWAMRTKSLEAHGERFHALVNEASRGLSWPDHPHDPAHERAVGAALLMIERGQPVKSIEFYNRWGRLAGYPEVHLLSSAPVLVDMSVGEAVCVLGMGADGMEILLCR